MTEEISPCGPAGRVKVRRGLEGDISKIALKRQSEL
jgi:hypothetical protein